MVFVGIQGVHDICIHVHVHVCVCVCVCTCMYTCTYSVFASHHPSLNAYGKVHVLTHIILFTMVTVIGFVCKFHIQEQLNIVAAVTTEQGTRARRRPSVPAQERHPINVVAGASMMRTPELQCMTPLLRFLQLLCENHNNRMQVRMYSTHECTCTCTCMVHVHVHLYYMCVYGCCCKALTISIQSC